MAGTDEFDRRMMAIALVLARRGLGQTAPNPSVGAVIADPASGEVIARAWTQPGGRPHAEPVAIERAGDKARGATLYVTLEPCSHFGKTPPCADAIIAAGLSRVVAAIEDPDPRVTGRGLERLCAAGLVVDRGLLGAEAHWITRGHIVRVTERRPFVQLKLATARDGNVPRGGGGQPTWITSPQARSLGHLMRAEADAILIGHRTALDDDPELTCRLPGLEHRSPIRVVLAREADGLAASKLVQTTARHPVWVFCGRSAGAETLNALRAAGVRVFPVATIGGELWLPAVMEQLVAEGITRLLVEGGGTMWRAFASAGLVDEVALFMGSDGATSTSEDDAFAALRRHLGPIGLALNSARGIGGDRLFVFRKPA